MRTLNPLNTATVLLMLALGALPAFNARAADAPKTKGAAHVESISGSSLKRVVLTKKAAERLDIKTGAVTADSAGALSTPYASVLYDVKGNTWVYTNPEPLVYVRHAITVMSVKGPSALLKTGPAAGTAVVVVGASELYGAESGVGH